MNKLYPLKFQPIFKEKLWGGQKMKTMLGMDIGGLPNCGEAWLISGVSENQTIVSEGYLKDNETNELVEVFMGDLVGDQVYEEYGNEFPLLLKILDSKQYLSLQVHPDDDLAYRRHKSLGKSEMWYVIDAGEDAELVNGFSQKVNKESFMNLLQGNKVKEILNIEKVRAHDVFYNPAGRIHALGPDILLAEIQQSSDITYRLSDWGRLDENGKARELHTELALDALDFNVYPEYKIHYADKENGTVNLLKSRHFNCNLIKANKSIRKDYHELDSFVILLCLQGKFQLGYDEGHSCLATGECILVPNDLKIVYITPQPMARILEVYIV